MKPSRSALAGRHSASPETVTWLRSPDPSARLTSDGDAWRDAEETCHVPDTFVQAPLLVYALGNVLMLVTLGEHGCLSLRAAL